MKPRCRQARRRLSGARSSFGSPVLPCPSPWIDLASALSTGPTSFTTLSLAWCMSRRSFSWCSTVPPCFITCSAVMRSGASTLRDHADNQGATGTASGLGRQAHGAARTSIDPRREAPVWARRFGRPRSRWGSEDGAGADRRPDKIAFTRAHDYDNNDILSGGSGRDRLSGAPAAHRLSGGAGGTT